MIDLHCHILAGIDDGAKSIDEALALIRLAEQQGVSRMVATPHIHIGIFDNNLQTISTAFTALTQAAKQSALNVELYAAAEVRIAPEIPMFIEQQQLPFLGRFDNHDVLLLELPSSHIPAGTDNLINWLLARNVLPMIAHPERNRELQSYPERLNAFVQAGCLFQLTASSLLGDMGASAKHLSEHWIKQRVYSIVASDCHSTKRRPPKMAEATQFIATLTAGDYAEQISTITPKLISDALGKH
ncbi:capsule biosynthesis protein CapC [Shewanella inventionis]|uniref:tyrosine-protein phosphatase n=1 Tax=Shewanella inventionis TaxID=1738770 RepID=UPI001CC1685E|nr:CpsB/CapC family capsule biosynthesis tyrosine phosphatase [Shewanella inventionis]UAL45130.1 capsule biosynthesis protein CapC [Shewanella inventionis]